MMGISKQRSQKPSLANFLLLAAVVLIVAGLLLLVTTQLAQLWTVAAALVVLFFLAAVTGGFIALWGISRASLPLVLLSYTQWSLAVLYPLAMVSGRLLGMKKDAVRGAFIDFHNELGRLRRVKVAADEILLLLPHCIQWSDCRFRITTDVNNCRHCGQCTVGSLLELRKKYGFHMAVATGGTLARKIIMDIRPKVVVGVACERDLAAGIQDVQKIHVVGILNDRPHGPCFNTSLDVELVEQTIRSLLKSK